MQVNACPECASTEMRTPGTRDGGALGGSELMLLVCSDCGFRGAPVLFEDEAAYEEFWQAKRLDAEDATIVPDGDAPPDPPEELDPALRELLATPAPPPPRGTAAFIAILGVPMAAFGGFSLATGTLAALGGWWAPMPFLLGGLCLGLGIAFLRIAARMWRGG